MIVMRGPENQELYCEQVEYDYSNDLWICWNVNRFEEKTIYVKRCTLNLYWDIAYETEDTIDGSPKI